MFKYLATLICLLGLLPASTAGALALMPNTPAQLRQASAWETPAGESVIATPSRIAALNKSMLSSTMCELAQYPVSVSGATVRQYLQHYRMDYQEGYYNQQGQYIGSSTRQAIAADAVAGVPATVQVRYAVVTERSNLRTFPSWLQAFTSPGDTNFDMWQETAVDPGSPALILALNGKKTFAFVQLESYRGWLPLSKLATTDRATWLQFVQPKENAVVTARLLTLQSGTQRYLYQMGATLPLEGRNLLLPVRGAQGELSVVRQAAQWGESLHRGFLPYTRNNIIRMAFKHLGAPYGWGGLKNSVDCSALVQDVYRTMGVRIPRNGDEQENAHAGVNLRGLSWEGRATAVKQLEPGAVLFSPTHVMLYLGQYQNRPYMLHALSSYGAPAADGSYYKKYRVLEVVVSEVYLRGASGTQLLMQLTKAVDYK